MAAKTKEWLLTKHKESPFLTQNEVDVLTAFKVSKSWASKFAQKSGLCLITLHGESGSVDIEAVQFQIVQLQELIKMYHIDHVYNMDETGLFFKVLPNHSYVKKSESETAHGTKLMKAKDRVTLYITTNADGMDKVPLSMIGKAQEPSCFDDWQHLLPTKYFSQKKAWSDSINKLLNKLPLTLLCTIRIDKCLFDCRVLPQQGCNRATRSGIWEVA
jgi:hypothetical protein